MTKTLTTISKLKLLEIVHHPAVARIPLDIAKSQEADDQVSS